MNGYYAQPQPGMNPQMQMQMGGYGMNGMNAMGGMNGMNGMMQGMPMSGMGMNGMGMNPIQQQQMQQQQQQQMAMAGMGMQPGMMGQGMPGQGYGQAWRQLGYDYTLPTLGYKPEASWGAWDLANAHTGSLDRGVFDGIISTLTNFFANRHLSEDAAREAHRRVYHHDQGADAGNKTLGGAAAYQAFLIWDRDHYSAYHTYPSADNRERLVGLAVAELFRLWETVQPRSSRASTEEAGQYAAATAKYLFDRHYEIPGHARHGRNSGYFGDDDSDGGSDARRMPRRSMYGNTGYGMQPGMGIPNNGMMGMPQPGMGMGMAPGIPGMGMSQPGYGAMGMPGAMGYNGQFNGGGMGMGGMQNGLAMGMIPMGGGHPGIGESQAAPGMHPYTYGNQSGVAWGNQPIDQMGNPMMPGQGRGFYGYGQQRYY